VPGDHRKKLDKKTSLSQNRPVKKILLVDNLRSFLEKEESILSSRGLKIFTAASGEEAVSIHRNEKVDLIVASLDMPGMGGDALCSLIRKDKEMRGVSVIIVCQNRKPDLDRCTHCGANSFITKPFDPSQFLDKISTLIEIPKRSGVRVLIKVSMKGKQQADSFFCTSVNISTSGILLETDRTLLKGDLITCSFFIPGSDSIAVECEVMRVDSISPEAFHCGVKFLGLSPDHKSAIEAFVRKQTR
jgi:CheY-like chemotaxis protein